MEKANKKKLPLSVFEIVWYSVTGAIGLWGLTFIVLGVVARNLKSDAPLVKASESYKAAMGLDFYGWGLILFVLGVVLAVIVLLINAKKSDREVEKQQRRAARLAAASATEVKEPSEEEAK